MKALYIVGVALSLLSTAWAQDGRPVALESEGDTGAALDSVLKSVDARVSEGCGADDLRSEIIKHCPLGKSAAECYRDHFARPLSSGSTRVVLQQSEALPVNYADTKGVLGDLTSLAGSTVQTLESLSTSVAKQIPIPAVSGVVEDFISPQILSYLQALGDLEDPQTLGYTVNVDELPFVRLKASVFATPSPTISPALKAQLVQQRQAETLAKVTDDLAIGDDYLVDGTISIVNTWIGPEFNHSNSASQLLENFVRSKEVSGYLTAMQNIHFNGNESDVSVAAARMACIVRSVNARISNLQGGRYIPDFWKLVQNQPQVSVRYRRLNRDGVVGASADSVSIRVATGFSNLTWLRLFEKQCKTSFENKECAEAYTRENESLRMKRGVGVAAYYERGTLADVSIDLPLIDIGIPLPEIPGLPVGLEPDGRFTLQGGDYQRYGWSLGMSLLDPKLGDILPKSMRVDLAGDYYAYDNSPVRLDHQVMRLTVTYKRGPLSLPFHLMFRTKSELEARVADKVVLGLGSGLSF